MLSTIEASEAVFKGEDGVLAGVSATSAIVDCATLTPERMVSRNDANDGVPLSNVLYLTLLLLSQQTEMYEAVKAKGGSFLEAPVSGSKAPAEQGTLIFMTSGDK